jgi:hypothetical protein
MGVRGRAAISAAMTAAVVILATGCTEDSQPASPVWLPACGSAATPAGPDLWAVAFALDAFGRSADASKAAVTALTKTGGLPEADEQCAHAKKLLQVQPVAVKDRIADHFKDWWWLWALAIVAAFVLAGLIVRRSRWRKRRWPPRVRLIVEDADAAATGLDVGPRVGAAVHALMLQADRQGFGTRVNTAGASDAQVELPPLDQVPDQVSWLLSLLRWLGRRNHLRLRMNVARGQAGGVACLTSLQEPTGRVARIGRKGHRSELFVRAAKGDEPVEEDYMALPSPVATWTIFQLEDVVGTTPEELTARLGTSDWRAYAAMLEGVDALDRGDSERAREHFAHASQLDPGDQFWELRLNKAFADARSDEVMLWVAAAAEFDRLSDLAP